MIEQRYSQARLAVPQGDVAAFAWALRDTAMWRGQIRARTADIETLFQTFRSCLGGADPMLFIPETGLVMHGRISEMIAPRAISETLSDLGFTFAESPLLLAEEVA